LPRGSPSDLLDRVGSLGIDAKTCDHGTGERMDLGYAVDALIAVAGS
jgi:hypothetical protein